MSAVSPSPAQLLEKWLDELGLRELMHADDLPAAEAYLTRELESLLRDAEVSRASQPVCTCPPPEYAYQSHESGCPMAEASRASQPSPSLREAPAKIKLSTGRLYLDVAGVIVAVEADICRDPNLPRRVWPNLPRRVWDEENLKEAARTINAALAPEPSPLAGLVEQLEASVKEMRAEVLRIGRDFDIYSVPSVTVWGWLDKVEAALRSARGGEQ